MADPTFLEKRIDPRITEGAQGGPVGQRDMVRRPSGWLDQEFYRSYAMHRYDVSHGIKTLEQFEAVRALFYVVMFTPYLGFRFKDWSDYLATLANSRATFITGSTTVLQLQRVYAMDDLEYLRDIFKPVSSTVVVYRTRTGVTSAISSTVDYETGRATISGHTSGDTYSWTGEFDVPVTFTDDEWIAEMRGYTERLFMSSLPIKLEEIRVRVA